MSARAWRVGGWMLIGAGAVVFLYLIYSLAFTNLETGRAQAELRDQWAQTVSEAPDAAPEDAAAVDDAPDVATPAEDRTDDGDGEAEDALPGNVAAEDDEVTEDSGAPAEDPEPVSSDDGSAEEADGAVPEEEDPRVGGDGGGDDEGAEPAGDARPISTEAVAMLEFSRPGRDTPPVRDEPLFVVSDVTLEHLKRGPGHYPASAKPGGSGNFAVAGHRTTYGSPFFHLDELRAGDRIHVTDRNGARHTYAVREQRIVAPSAVWVVGSDPLGTGAPTLTLTTCHPRFSARQRLVVFAELVT